MPTVVDRASHTIRSLHEFLCAVEGEDTSILQALKVDVPKIIEQAQTCLAVFEEEFHPKRPQPSKDTKSLLSLPKEIERLKNSLRYQTRCREEGAAQLEEERSCRLGNRIRNLWFVRVGLAPPQIPQQTLHELLSEFPREEVKAIF